jgi:hypothetical protein
VEVQDPLQLGQRGQQTQVVAVEAETVVQDLPAETAVQVL